MRQEWREQKLDLQKAGLAFRQANDQGKEIPAKAFQALAERFSPNELAALETYLVFTCLGLTGADYLTQAEMEEKINEEKQDETCSM